MPTSQPANQIPMGICGLDPTSGLAYSLGCWNYTPISANGTNTVKNGGGLWGGLNVVNTGTTWVFNIYDVVVTGTTTATNTISTGTSTAGFNSLGTPPIGGVRFVGSLVIINTGTAGLANALWD